MSEEKVYAGLGKEIETQYGQLLKLSFSKDDVQKMQDNLNEKGWVNFDVKKRREPSDKGVTHYLELNTFKGETKPTAKVEEPESEIPF